MAYAREAHAVWSVLADAWGKSRRRLRVPCGIGEECLTSSGDGAAKTGGRVAARAREFWRKLTGGAGEPEPGEPQLRRSERSAASDAVEVSWFDEDGGRRETSGQIVDFTEEGFGVTTAEALPVGHIVWLVSPGCDERKAVVRHCDRLGEGLADGPDDAPGDGWRSGVYWVKSERRRVDRWPVSGSARLAWTEGGERHEVMVEVMDVTEGGSRVDSPVAIPVGQTCEISGEKFWCQGRICNQVQAPEDRYRIGIEFYRSHAFDVREDRDEVV